MGNVKRVEMTVIFVLVLISCMSLGHCLTCYQCMSARSWGDCGSETKKQTCPPGWSACIKAELKIPRWEETLYAKGCVNAEGCKDFRRNVCSDASQISCSVHCCSGDKCNRGILPTASTITFLACAFVAYISSSSSLIKELLF